MIYEQKYFENVKTYVFSKTALEDLLPDNNVREYPIADKNDLLLDILFIIQPRPR